MNNINIMSFNEWKESDNYKFDIFMQEKERDIKEWFDTDAFKKLELTNITYNTANINNIYVLMFEFNETDDIQWIFHIIIDGSTLQKDDIIEELDIEYSCVYEGEPLIKNKRNIKTDEFNAELIVTMVDEYKKENIK